MVLGLELYRRQHASVLDALASLDADLGATWDDFQAETTRRDLVSLSGKLTVHLQMEDRGLYPALLASADPEVTAVAASFQRAMGGLKATTDVFFHRWAGHGAIVADPMVFRHQARAVLRTISERIAAEDVELYPLAERVG